MPVRRTPIDEAGGARGKSTLDLLDTLIVDEPTAWEGLPVDRGSIEAASMAGDQFADDPAAAEDREAFFPFSRCGFVVPGAIRAGHAAQLPATPAGVSPDVYIKSDRKRPEPATTIIRSFGEPFGRSPTQIVGTPGFKRTVEDFKRRLGGMSSTPPAQPAPLTPAQQRAADAGKALAFANDRATERQDAPLMLSAVRGHEAEP